MKLLPFEGLMIPGINFQDHCIWVLDWTKITNKISLKDAFLIKNEKRIVFTKS